MPKNLQQLRTECRYRADMESTQFVSDAELNTYINASLGELYDLLIRAYGEDYLADAYEFTTTSSVAAYGLPDSVDGYLYKLSGVDMTISGQTYTLSRFNFNERNLFQNSTISATYSGPLIRYRLFGSEIHFSPAPGGSYATKLWYIKHPTQLVNDWDEPEGVLVNNWLEYVIVDVAIKMLIKEESDVSVLMARKDRLERRLNEMVENRDFANPETVKDPDAENWFY